MKMYPILAGMALLFLASCGSETTTAPTETATTPAAEPYKITPFEPSAEFAKAKINSMTFKDSKFTFEVGGEGYELGAQTPDAGAKMCANSAKGQHIHLIVDNEPYAAKYEPSFDYPIADGDHYLLAFLSRSYHESIKTPDAHVAMKATIKAGNFSNTTPVTDPMVFYSRPKGEYIGKAETEKVMLDFYLLNCSLGENFKVIVDINGLQQATLDTWQPYYIEGLPLGENKITLTLVDGTGAKVASPLNPVERTFTLKEDPAPGQ